MPTLKGIHCSIELKGSSLCLGEYETLWVEDAVECYVAIPNAPTDFIVHLTCSEYIAPVLSAFVYIDGVFQCNRYKRGLLPRDKDGSLEKSKVDFRFQQKEELLQGGHMLAHPWRFERLNIVAADAIQGLQLADVDIIQNVGTIDVVILRGQDNPEYPHFNPYDVPRLPKSPQQSRRRNNTTGEFGVFSGLFDGPSDDPLSDDPFWQVDGPGAGSASRYNTHHRHGPLPRTDHQGVPHHGRWYNHDRYKYFDETDAGEWKTEDYFMETPPPPMSRRYRYRQDSHERRPHCYGTHPHHIRREYPHRHSFQRAYDNEEDDRRQYEAFLAGMYVGREDVQVPQYIDSPPRRHRQEERYINRASASYSRPKNPGGHTVVVNQFPSDNARNVSIDTVDDSHEIPQTCRVTMPFYEPFESSSDCDSSQRTDQSRQHRSNKVFPLDPNVSGSIENTENIIQNVEPLVRKIVKDIVKDVVERFPSEKASLKQDGKPNFHYNHEPEDGGVDDEPTYVKSMPGAYPPSTSSVCIRYKSGTGNALPGPFTNDKTTNQSERQVHANVNHWRLEYKTASQSINQESANHRLTRNRPLAITQYPADRSNDPGARSNISFKPSRQTSPNIPRRQQSGSRSRPARRSAQSGDGKHRSKSRAKGQSQDNKKVRDQYTEDGRHGNSPNDGVSKKNKSKKQIDGAGKRDVGDHSNNNRNTDNKRNNWDNSKQNGSNNETKPNDLQNDGWDEQQNNWDQSNSWDKSNDKQICSDNWNQNNENDWSAPQQQTSDWGHAKKNNDPSPEPEPSPDFPSPPSPSPPPLPETKDANLREKSKTAMSLSISQPRTYWYKRPGGDAYTPPACQNEHHNQPSNAARKRHMSALDAEVASIHLEQPLYTIPESAARARHVEHQVRGGKGIEKVHKVGRPIYWDTLDKPYAVIRFKYRSKKCLEEILQYKITETEEEFRERLGVLTKEQLIDECVMRKKHGWDTDAEKAEKDEKTESAIQQPELEVPWP